jgi:hypothetical protein
MDDQNEENPYESPQFADLPAKNPQRESIPNAKEILQAIYFAVFQQIILAIFFALILDGGVMLHRWFFAMIASWIMSFAILLRHFFRFSKPITTVDIGIIKFGVWPAMVLVLICEIIIGAFL